MISNTNTMTQTDINNAINAAFDNLFSLNEQLFDYWYWELHKTNDYPISERWNEETLYQMEKDVMMNS